jgi:Cys-tRNA(Pro)/Cys-tRNA(Cys) deacylase
MKTNAVRVLEKQGVRCELRTYEVDESDLSGIHVARSIGLPQARVFKTLVARGDRTGVLVACIPVDAELDLKEFARESGNRKVDLVPLKEIQPLTGYVRGGVSPAGMKKKFPVYLDRSAFDWETISVSAGMRGMQMLVPPDELARVVGALPLAIVRREGDAGKE